ncbi:MAG: PIN domain-containing protein [Polyangiaceae bacterium]
MLLDTNVVSAFLKPGAEQRSPKLVAFVTAAVAAQSLTISAFTEFELRRGVEELVTKGQGQRRLVALLKFLDRCDVLGLDGGGGWDFAAKLWARGRALKPAVVLTDLDLLIAATAAFHRRPFATSEVNLVKNLAAIGLSEVTLVPNE